MFLNCQNISICFLRLILNIQISIYRNIDFLIKSAIIVGVLLGSALFIYLFFRREVAIIFRQKTQ